MKVLSIVPTAGLNNQRAMLLGACLIALQSNARLYVGGFLRDFVPVSPGASLRKKAAQPVPFGDVFDLDSFVAALARHGLLSDAAPDEMLDVPTCFKEGSTAMRTSQTDPVVMDLCLSLRASPQIVEQANLLIRALPTQTFGLQLRIENDWRRFIGQKWKMGDGTGDGVRNDGLELTTADPRTILAKVAQTPPLGGRPMLACCHQSDLPLGLEDIRAIAAGLGHALHFKSDFDVRLPSSVLGLSMFDFTTCLGLPAYVGLTRSSFSQMLWTIRAMEGIASDHYIYNNPEPWARLRHGPWVNPQRAVDPELATDGFAPYLIRSSA